MRLTLRTLLAYLDNILEPSAAQAMAQKLEESPAAAELVHRIRDVTKKVRLAAPNVEGKGLGLDANTVAEYLDNTLQGDRTPDFEMVCLESDVHLAEVAACHEILSLVLVKPAEIDPTSRQKMYGLVAQATTAKPAAASAAAAPAMTATPVAAPVAMPVGNESPRRREIPDYLRGEELKPNAKARGGWLMAAVAVLALLLVGGAAALALAPVDDVPEFLRPLARMLHPSPTVATNEERVVLLPPKPAGTLPEATGTQTEVTTPTGGTTPPVIVTELRQPDSVTAITPAGTAGAANATTVVTTGAGELRQPASAVSPSAVIPTTTTPGATTVTVPPVPDNTTSGTTVVVPSTTVMTPPAPGATATGTGATPAVTVNVGPSTTPSNVTVAVTPTTPPVVPAAAIEPVGRVSSAVSQVLLRFDRNQNAWVRLPAREQLMTGDRILALPDYRPQIALANGLTIDLLGGTLLELTPIDAAGNPGVRVLRGRLMMFTVGGAKASLRVDNCKPAMTFALSTAELALEYVSQRPPGADPAAPNNPWLIMLYAKSGLIEWSAGAGMAGPLAVPGVAALGEAGAPAPVAGTGELPGWLVNDERDLLRKQAADFVEMRLRSDKAVSVSLREILSDKPPRAENMQLALECLAQIGEFMDFMPLLRDPTQRYSAWDRYLGILATAIDYGPDYAAAVRDIFVMQHGPQGEAEYRMLCGYTDEQLKAGAALFLIESLDHAELDYRVVAYWTLSETTGLSLAYLPQDPPQKRKAAIQKWQQKLEAGQIVRKKLS